MRTVGEIEAAIENLPMPEVEVLALWLEAYRARGAAAETWLKKARGAARPGVMNTSDVMALTRGDE
ncbi:MAG: hypothetical protein QOC81_4971 [Thermoanaerobaculia bacterium]|jgi:hypothetical protein|nr:hypothetical protein [Thermoanaerobaculia bacterium]